MEISSVLQGIGVFIFGVLAHLSPTSFPSSPPTCPIIQETREVRGDSMTPLIPDGQMIQLLSGYYACHPLERNDVVVLQDASDTTPLIKMVRALGGDALHLAQVDGGWQIRINDQVLLTSDGRPYLLDEQRSQMLRLYEDDYHGVIPQGTIIVLGDHPGGTLDSTRFGLVSQKEILGKVQW